MADKELSYRLVPSTCISGALRLKGAGLSSEKSE
jgi:hypothetical protein